VGTQILVDRQQILVDRQWWRVERIDPPELGAKPQGRVFALPAEFT